MTVEVRDALAAIRRTSRDAARDVRRLVGMLRTDTDHDLVPLPALAALPELIRSTRTAGLPVTFATTGDVEPVSAGAQLAIYRIVQEGLTNVAKHGSGTPASVALRWCPSAVAIEITNDGPAIDGGPVRPGHGLAGARERVELYGGALEAGPGPAGGFRLHAVIPLP